MHHDGAERIDDALEMLLAQGNDVGLGGLRRQMRDVGDGAVGEAEPGRAGAQVAPEVEGEGGGLGRLLDGPIKPKLRIAPSQVKAPSSTDRRALASSV